MARPLPKLDRLGRPQKDLHKLFSHIDGILQIAEWAPPIKVPSQFWTLDVADGEKVAVVSCPCGTEHVIALLECPLGSDSCERFFTFTGGDVWAFNSARDRVVEEPEEDGDSELES